METGGNRESGRENRGGGVLDYSSLGNFMCLPLSDKVFEMIVGSEHWNGVNSSFSCGWTPLDSVAHNVEIVASPISSHGNSSSNYVQQSQGTSSTSRLIQFESDDNLAELEPNIPCFGSGTYSEMDSFFFLHGCRWIANSGCSSDYPLDGSNNKTEKASMPQIAGDNYAQSQEEHKISDEGIAKSLTEGKKRRRMCDNWSQFPSLKNSKTEKGQGPGGQDMEKLKPELKPVAKTCCQINGKEVKDSSTSGDAPNEDYVHVRAKRGQATNSHSLAERVRREKIRERMKFLQDLVPGCNKITGKAVMLDEIINYVLSLQRQVEFLSVKLSTVFPETNVELEQNLSRDIRHSQAGSAAILGDPGMSCYPKEILQGALATQTPNIESSSMPNAARIWGSELQNTSQMDFISDLAPDKPESNGFIDVKL